MGILVEYSEKKRQLEALKAELQQLENSEDLKKELEFKTQLEKLLEKYTKTAADAFKVLSEIDPSIATGGAKKAAKPASSGRTRALMVYKNPHTGEVVKTRGGNTKTLKEWREKYGADKVDSWKEKA
ncbi:histone-like nucleoid-structuring protein, MvaT/MvaU family [Mangrovitalea sediminis]|uniref:histone-like nucleoid-structuring protein, MvaT/MvaU family n=1 Tax=Mangrovitalea sediminis TaxID=1982043 RepID=UPI000BE61652|nr:histone-like nucleoid-structuring protein, MvaT/MvaU family [Mangrovitalea sediminis]